MLHGPRLALLPDDYVERRPVRAVPQVMTFAWMHEVAPWPSAPSQISG